MGVIFSNEALGLKSTMSHKIEILWYAEIIKVTHESTLTFEQRTHIFDELCRDYNIFKRFRLLIDVRNIKQEMTFVEQEVFAHYISSRDELKGAFVAVLINIDQLIDEFLIKEAFRKGLDIRLFGSEDKALSWLGNKT